MGSSPLWITGLRRDARGALTVMSEQVRRAAALRASEGLSERDLNQRLREGRLVRVRRGVFTEQSAGNPRRQHLQLARAVALDKVEPVFSHITAAVAWGLPVENRQLDRVRLIRRHGHGHGRSLRDAVEYQAGLSDDEIALASGLVVTSVPRTVIDLARTSLLECGVVAADAALRLRLCTRDDLVDAVAAAKGRRGVARAGRAVAFADPRAESPLESVSRLTISRCTLPQPVLQHAIEWQGRRVATTDFAWPDQRVVGECDGAGKYGDLLEPGQTAQDAIMAEKRREDLIRQAGWWVVRWDWQTSWNQRRLEERIRSALDFQTFGRVASA